MNMIRHAVAALAFFAIGISLYMGVYNGLSDSYGFEDEYTLSINGSSERTLMESLNDLNIIQGMNQTTTAIMQIRAPQGGGISLDKLAEAAIGIFSFIFGIFTFVPQILGIIIYYYPIPGAIMTGVVVIMVIYIAFIYYSRNLRGEV